MGKKFENRRGSEGGGGGEKGRRRKVRTAEEEEEEKEEEEEERRTRTGPNYAAIFYLLEGGVDTAEPSSFTPTAFAPAQLHLASLEEVSRRRLVRGDLNLRPAAAHRPVFDSQLTFH